MTRKQLQGNAQGQNLSAQTERREASRAMGQPSTFCPSSIVHSRMVTTSLVDKVCSQSDELRLASSTLQTLKDNQKVNQCLITSKNFHNLNMLSEILWPVF